MDCHQTSKIKLTKRLLEPLIRKNGFCQDCQFTKIMHLKHMSPNYLLWPHAVYFLTGTISTCTCTFIYTHCCISGTLPPLQVLNKNGISVSLHFTQVSPADHLYHHTYTVYVLKTLKDKATQHSTNPETAFFPKKKSCTSLSLCVSICLYIHVHVVHSCILRHM